MVDRTKVDLWRRAVAAEHSAAKEKLAELDRQYVMAGREPGISMVLLLRRGGEAAVRTLTSVADQTLTRGEFEVIAVLPQSSEPAYRAVLEARQAEPRLRLRAVRVGSMDPARARRAGVAAARYAYTTFLTEGERLGAGTLELLRANAGPAVLAMVPVITVLGQAAADPFAADGGKVIATNLIEHLSYESAADADALLFWLTVLVRTQVTTHRCRSGDAAVRCARASGSDSSPPSFEAEVAGPLEVVARLERLRAEADDECGQVLDAQLAVQADRVAGYLAHEPAAHASVVTALDRAPVARFPYHRVNRVLGGRELVVAYAFPPYADTSAVVTAKRVRAEGRVVDVVVNAMDRIRDTDESLRRISGPFLDRAAVLRTPTYFMDWKSMESFTAEGLAVIEEWQRNKGHYQTLYSRAHFAASHVLAAAFKLAHPDVVWRAEFSDPLSRDVLDRERGSPVKPGELLAKLRAGMSAHGLPVPESENCLVWCEEVTYALADELIFTNPNQLEYMAGYCSRPDLAAMVRDKARISPHPTLASEFYSMVDCAYELDPGVTNIAYFGNFYPTRGLDDVLVALAKSDPRLRSQVRLHVFTTKPVAVQERAAELGVEASVKARSYVPYLEFLNLTTKFDCLLANDAVTAGVHSCNPYLPSKWGDYRGSGTPVWGLVEAGSPLSRQPLAYTSPTGDVEAASATLAELVRRHGLE